MDWAPRIFREQGGMEQFSIECKSEKLFALVLLTCDLWLVQKIGAAHASNQMQN